MDGYYGDERSNYVQNVPLRLTIENLAQELKDELDHCSSEFGVESSGAERRRNNDPPFYHEVAQHNRHHHPFSSQARTRQPITAVEAPPHPVQVAPLLAPTRKYSML